MFATRIAQAGHVLKDRAISRDHVEHIIARLHGWIDNPAIDVIITMAAPARPGAM